MQVAYRVHYLPHVYIKGQVYIVCVGILHLYEHMHHTQNLPKGNVGCIY